MVPRLSCYVVIVTLISGIFVFSQIHQATAENDEQIQALFKSNLTRNEFSNLLQSLIKLNEDRVNVLKKISNLDDYKVLVDNEVLRSGDQKSSESTDLKNLYLVILSKNESNPTRRNMGERVKKPIANKLRKRSIVSTLEPFSNPIHGPPDIEPQKGLNIARIAKMNLRTKNRYEIDDGSHLFSTLGPVHNFEDKMYTKRIISSEEETEENHQSTSQPPRVSIMTKKQEKKAQGRFEIVTNTNTNANDYQHEASTDSTESKEKSNEYKDMTLTVENDRNAKLLKKQDTFSNYKHDLQSKPEKKFYFAKGPNNDGSKEGSESSKVTNNKPVSIETYGEEKEEKIKTSRDYPEYNTHQTKNNENKRYKLNKNKENTREKPHYTNQGPPASRDNSEEYSNNKKPKIMVGNSSEGDHRKLTEQIYKRPKLIKTHPIDHDRRIHIEDVKSRENNKPSKVSKVNSDHFSDDDRKISHEEKSSEKDYNKENKDNPEHFNEKSNHKINLYSKEHRSSEEDEANTHKEYLKEDEYQSNTNSHKSSEKHSNKRPKMTSDHFSDADHRMTDKSSEHDLDNRHNLDGKRDLDKDNPEHFNEKSNHKINLYSKEHRSSEEDEANIHKEYFKEDKYQSNTNSHKSSEKHSNKRPKMTSDHFSDADHRMTDKSSEHDNRHDLDGKRDLDSKHDLDRKRDLDSQRDFDSKPLKASLNHNDNNHRISLDVFTKNQNNKHKTSVKDSNENDHRPNQDDNKSHEKQPTNKNKSSSKYSNEMNKSYEKDDDKKHIARDIKQPSRDSNEQAHKIALKENKPKKKMMVSQISKQTPKYNKDLIDHKPKINVKNDQSNDDDDYTSHKDDVKHSEELDHKINDSENKEMKNENDYKNTKINKDELNEFETHGNSYSKPRKEAPLSREEQGSIFPSISHETPERNGYDETNKDLPNKSEHKSPKDLSALADDEKMSKLKHPSFEDDHGEKQSETGKDYGGEDYRSSEDNGKSPNTRVVMKDKSQEVKNSKPPSAEVEHDQPGAKPQESRKNFVKCLSKKALKLCSKSCISAYKNVCRKMKCTSRSKKALKKECKRSCKKIFASSKSSKNSDDSGSGSW